MKNKKILIPILAIIAAILAVALQFLLLNNKSIQETKELNDAAQSNPRRLSRRRFLDSSPHWQPQYRVPFWKVHIKADRFTIHWVERSFFALLRRGAPFKKSFAFVQNIAESGITIAQSRFYNLIRAQGKKLTARPSRLIQVSPKRQRQYEASAAEARA